MAESLAVAPTGVGGADGLELEVVGCAVGEAGDCFGAVIAGIDPGVGEGAAGLTIAVLEFRDGQAGKIGGRGPCERDLSVAAGRG